MPAHHPAQSTFPSPSCALRAFFCSAHGPSDCFFSLKGITPPELQEAICFDYEPFHDPRGGGCGHGHDTSGPWAKNWQRKARESFLLQFTTFSTFSECLVYLQHARGLPAVCFAITRHGGNLSRLTSNLRKHIQKLKPKRVSRQCLEYLSRKGQIQPPERSQNMRQTTRPQITHLRARW